MAKQKLLCIGDHFISSSLMKAKLGALADQFDMVEASTPFPLEPFRDIAEVREASGSEEQMAEVLKGVSICIAHHAPLTKKVMEQCPDLKLFVVCRGGPVNVNVPAATEHGITIAYTPARNAAATAEHTIAMILSALRNIPATDAAIRSGQWAGDYTYQTAGFELETATAGLIGYGAIGRIVARILRAFGAKVLVYDPFAKIDPSEGVEQVSDLNSLLDRAQVVSLHARETKESKGILGRKQIARLQKGSVVVNCARGSLMDYDALADALKSGHLFAAAADVFPQEPLPADSPLLQFPNFIMTPHIAGGTKQAAEKAATIAAEELKLFLEGKPLRYCANPKK
ncbi:MAG: 2-hydroxyacid dehydrogenase [Acidobacteria bacterium]|nr:2-hydroxyacid dehydrogenase [Acidobacteriota bacterium]